MGRRGGPNSLMNRDPSLLSPEVAETSHYPGGHAEGFPDAFKQLDLAFYSYIAAGCTGKPNFPTFADGHREVQICEAIAQSTATRNGCRCREPEPPFPTRFTGQHSRRFSRGPVRYGGRLRISLENPS